jgi:glucosyl-dolichyl phosphate glucuronosyltransferase
MKISIIIPTHNRADQLKTAIDSIVLLRDEADCELIVVDNNSTDNTPSVVNEYGEFARYVFEPRTAFTRARSTGGENATGDILLFLDDDVIVNKGSLANIVRVFSEHQDCAVIAGKIDPKFEVEPPAWTLDCQKTFNGWSLFNKESFSFIHDSLQEVPSAAGPMMAIRRDVYDRIGGFPPDTVGVETNRGNNVFNKLYIGPGDYGLCIKAREAGFKILYSPDISVFHVIPAARLSVAFWRSRMIGEGYHDAITQRAFFHKSVMELSIKRLRTKLLFRYSEWKLLNKIKNSQQTGKDELLPEELWVNLYKAYLDMDKILETTPRLVEFLWGIGIEGVNDENFELIISKLPHDFKSIVGDGFIYNSQTITTQSDYKKFITRNGMSRPGSGLFLNVIFPLFLIAKFFKNRLQN